VKGATWGSPFAIIGTYGGDSNNVGSSGSDVLTIPQVVITTAASSSASPGHLPTCASATQPVTVIIYNSSTRVRTPVTIGITTLGNLGSGTTGLVTTGFYEIYVSGITYGTAFVCIYNTQVGGTTQMEYYHSLWLDALNVSRNKGPTISGDIPVSALNYGALVAIGTPIDPQSLQSAWAISARAAGPSGVVVINTSTTGAGTPTAIIAPKGEVVAD